MQFFGKYSDFDVVFDFVDEVLRQWFKDLWVQFMCVRVLGVVYCFDEVIVIIECFLECEDVQLFCVNMELVKGEKFEVYCDFFVVFVQ